jgi:hypothetical protein
VGGSAVKPRDQCGDSVTDVRVPLGPSHFLTALHPNRAFKIRALPYNARLPTDPA